MTDAQAATIIEQQATIIEQQKKLIEQQQQLLNYAQTVANFDIKKLPAPVQMLLAGLGIKPKT